MTATVQTTALLEAHETAGARMVDFAGWRMPIQYAGVMDEHAAVRERLGLFDLSHMAEIELSGAEAGAALAWALVGDARRLTVGRAHYSMICAPDGGVIDDLIVYRLETDLYLVVANAANAAVVLEELAARSADHDCRVVDRSAETTLVALQGPLSEAVLQPYCSVDLAGVRYYSAQETSVVGIDALVARTGYTGEDGFELFVAWEDGPELWRALLDAGAGAGVKPIGLGARDTLRLEAGMPLYGQELDASTTPYHAGLGRVVKLDKDDFVGRAALLAASEAPLDRRLVGLTVTGRGIARAGHRVRDAAGEPVGTVTSGTASPSLGRAIAMGYVPPSLAEPGQVVEVDVRGRALEAEVVRLPFYRRQEPA